MRRPWARMFPLLACLALLLSVHLTRPSLSKNTQPSPPGLTTELRRQNGNALLVVRSTERFELQLDDEGIAAWYDLRRDPQRRTNLVLPGTRLLEHRLQGASSHLRGPFSIQEQTPVRVRVVWQGEAGTPAQPFSITYTIWAGGQVAVVLETPTRATTTLRRDSDAITGAAMRAEPPIPSADGTVTQALMLALDAWTGERVGSLANATLANDDAQSTTPDYNPETGALHARAEGTYPLQLRLPAATVLRQPRFEIAGWPGADLTVRHGQTVLVEGVDYLANWNAETGQLILQYLFPLGGSSDDENVLTLTPAPAAATLRLGIAGRSVDANGRLVIDANMPDHNGTDTTLDIFRIPYIQSSPTFRARATLQGGGAGVKFVLLRGEGRVHTVVDQDAPYEATFTLPTFGEYRLDAYMLDGQGRTINASPDDSINPLGYGHIFVTIGDSITAGKYGGEITKDDPLYPVQSCKSELPADGRSKDCRNFYQYDNVENNQRPFYSSYHVGLNDRLTACSAAPVFLLNDGFSGINTARGQADRHARSKLAAYSDHIEKLGARHILLQLGTNDASQELAVDAWSDDLNKVIDGLQEPHPGLTIWVARLPWRNDDGDAAAITADYNEQIPAIVQAQNASPNRVRLGPDFYTLFQNSPALLDDDRLHPNRQGFNGMARLWADAVCQVLPAPAPFIFDQFLPLSDR